VAESEGAKKNALKSPKKHLSLLLINYIFKKHIDDQHLLAVSSKRLAIILCCGNSKCSKAFDITSNKRNSSHPGGNKKKQKTTAINVVC
jgi:hypothetical protein